MCALAQFPLSDRRVTVAPGNELGPLPESIQKWPTLQNWVVSLSYLDRSVSTEETGVPIGRVDQQTSPERDTTATRRSSTHGRSIQLPWSACAAASVAAIPYRGLARPSAMLAASCHGAKLSACTPATTIAVFPTRGALC